MIWIEMSRDGVHGGGEWAFAKCVWSPTHKNNEKRNQTWLFWENVKKVKEGDIILHLQGKGQNAYFTGYSVARTDGHETNERPPKAGGWAYSSSFYRAFLKDFISLKNPVHLYTVFSEKEEAFREYLRKKELPKNLFYTEQSGKLQCLNGGYLSEADEELVVLILGNQKEADLIEEQINHVEQSVQTNEALAQIKRRIGHEKFAENVKKNYGNHCCFPNCDVSDNNFLIASHIARWADNERKRGETSNGLCLCLIHDKAFEKGYFSLDDDLNICISNNENNSELFLKRILPYVGKRIKKSFVDPDRDALREHRLRCDILL